MTHLPDMVTVLLSVAGAVAVGYLAVQVRRLREEVRALRAEGRSTHEEAEAHPPAPPPSRVRRVPKKGYAARAGGEAGGGSSS